MMDLWEQEKRIAEEGYMPLCGVDEAGRGPLAGPVYAAACILPLGLEIPGLNDSKKLTEKKREALYERIISNAKFKRARPASESRSDSSRPSVVPPKITTLFIYRTPWA